MNEHSNPIEFLIDFAWANGADLFVVNNAKDELKKLRHKILDYDKAEQRYKMYYDYTSKQNLGYEIAAWIRLNSRGDLYDPTICYNEYLDPNTVLPLYVNKIQYKTKHEKLSE